MRLPYASAASDVYKRQGFFRAVGFGRHNAEELKRALIDVARTGTVVDVQDTPYGRKYIVDGGGRRHRGGASGVCKVLQGHRSMPQDESHPDSQPASEYAERCGAL